MNEKEARELLKNRPGNDHPLVHNTCPDCAAVGYLEALDKAKGLEEALRVLYEETADYIRVNNLGDIHHNQSMKMAKEALAKWRKEK